MFLWSVIMFCWFHTFPSTCLVSTQQREHNFICSSEWAICRNLGVAGRCAGMRLWRTCCKSGTDNPSNFDARKKTLTVFHPWSLAPLGLAAPVKGCGRGQLVGCVLRTWSTHRRFATHSSLDGADWDLRVASQHCHHRSRIWASRICATVVSSWPKPTHVAERRRPPLQTEPRYEPGTWGRRRAGARGTPPRR